jgi:transcription antitermination factor NusG
MKEWLLIYSKPNKTDLLSSEIIARGKECYYPVIRVKPVNPRSRKRRPYFPGYLFVKADPSSKEVAELRWLPGSNGCVEFDRTPAIVPDHVIKDIRQKVDALNASFEETPFGIKKGEAVEIIQGPLTGYSAIFDQRLSGIDRVRVLIIMLQAQQKIIEMPADNIRRSYSVRL